MEQVKVLKQNLDKANGVSEIIRKYVVSGNEKFVVFLKDTTHLRNMKPVIEKWFTDAGFTIRMYEVHCKNVDKDKEFQAFKEDTEEGIKLCLSVNMVAEGIHGDIDGVIMLRETMSPNLYFQMIGRAFSCGKKTIPLIFDLVANSQFISDAVDNFPNELRGEIEKRKEEFEKEGKDYEVGFNVDEFIVMDEFMDVVSGFREIEERLEGNWNLYIKALTEFKEKNGSCRVPTEYIHIFENGIRLNLGNWARDVRNNTRKGKTRYSLTSERINQLNNLGFVWDKRNRRRCTDIDITPNNRERQFKNKMNFARQALNEGVIITRTNNKYNGVDLYYWYRVNKNKFAKDEKEILKQLINYVPAAKRNVYKKMVLIIDIKNCKTNTYSSIADAGRALCNDFHLVNTERSGMTTVSRYLRVNSENSIYKGQFHFKYVNYID